jgi:hypothetical protein
MAGTLHFAYLQEQFLQEHFQGEKYARSLFRRPRHGGGARGVTRFVPARSLVRRSSQSEAGLHACVAQKCRNNDKCSAARKHAQK